MTQRLRKKPRRSARRVKRLARSLDTEYWPKGNGKRYADSSYAADRVREANRKRLDDAG